MHHIKKKGFTLVELIVVITILAILWTIAFISLQWYSENARDTKRVADVNNIKKALEFFVLNSEIYPMPDEVWAASYSWAEIYYQWRLWDNVTQNLSRNLKETPRDPVTEEAYIYSVTEDQQQYEITVVYESSVAHSSFLQTYADLSEWIVAITWNYNGLYVQTDDYAVPLPSITTSDTLPITLTSDTVKSQMTSWWTNRPSVWWAPSQTWALDISLSVYEWKVDVTSSNTEKKAFIQAIQWAYAGSSLAQWWSIYEEIVSKTSDADMVAFANGAIASTDWEAAPEVQQCPEWKVLSWEVCIVNLATFWAGGSDTLPLNVDNGSTIVIDTSITSSNKASFSCLLWYESDTTSPKYWFEWSGESVNVKTEWGCIVRDYSSSFAGISDLAADLSIVIYNSSYSNSSNMSLLPCDTDLSSASGNGGYYFNTTTGDITVVAGGGCLAIVTTITDIAGLFNTYDYVDGIGTDARFQLFYGDLEPVTSKNALFVADAYNHAIRKIDMSDSNYTVSTIAGIGGSAGNVDGINGVSKLSYPWSIVSDPSGNYLYVADANNFKIKRIDISNTDYTVSTFADIGSGTYPRAITIDPLGEYLYVAERNGQKIDRIEISSGTMETIAGNGTQGYTAGPTTGANAQFNQPIGLAVYGDSLFVTENNSTVLRKIDLSSTDYTTSTIAWIYGAAGSLDAAIGTNGKIASKGNLTMDYSKWILYILGWSIAEVDVTNSDYPISYLKDNGSNITGANTGGRFDNTDGSLYIMGASLIRRIVRE